MSWLIIASLIPLAGIIYQDYKFRAISWYWLPILFMFFFIDTYYKTSLETIFQYALLNSVFIVLNLSIVWGYFCLKNKKLINLFKTYLGIGDVLFLLCITPLFHPVNFMLFFVVSLLFTLIGSAIYMHFKEKRNQNIPLASWLGFHLVISLLVDLSISKDVLLNEII